MYIRFSRCFNLDLSRIDYLYLAELSILATRPCESFIYITCMTGGNVSSYCPSKAVRYRSGFSQRVICRNCSYNIET
jgi:hypothetical protein